jgi:hypothetical protein
MNTDFGLFHLSIAVRSMRSSNSFPRTSGVSSKDGPKLSEIDYSLVGSIGRRQRRQYWRHLFPTDTVKKSPLCDGRIVVSLTKHSCT